MLKNHILDARFEMPSSRFVHALNAAWLVASSAQPYTSLHRESFQHEIEEPQHSA
jgi:hypothetical protein